MKFLIPLSLAQRFFDADRSAFPNWGTKVQMIRHSSLGIVVRTLKGYEMPTEDQAKLSQIAEAYCSIPVATQQSSERNTSVIRVSRQSNA